MSIGTPLDSWYVWLGLALTSTLVAGVALSIPTQPPPDADRAAIAIEDIGTAEYTATATVETDAKALKISPNTIAMRNEAGIDRATIAVGTLIPLSAVENDSRRNQLSLILRGASPAAVLGSNASEKLRRWNREIQQRLETDGAHWQTSDGPIRARQISPGSGKIILLDVV